MFSICRDKKNKPKEKIKVLHKQVLICSIYFMKDRNILQKQQYLIEKLDNADCNGTSLESQQSRD